MYFGLLTFVNMAFYGWIYGYLNSHFTILEESNTKLWKQISLFDISLLAYMELKEGIQLSSNNRDEHN